MHLAMRSLLSDCNRHMSLEYPENLQIETRSGQTEVLRWCAHGFRKVNAHEVREACPRGTKRKFYYASSLASATSIFADGFLKKRGEAVMGQTNLSQAWFNDKNKGIVFEGNMYGEVTPHGTARRIEGWKRGWRDRFCHRPGHHIRKRKTGDSQYYMNEKTIELTGFYLEKKTKMVMKLRSVLMKRKSPCRRR